jgi:Na+/proline symporter
LYVLVIVTVTASKRSAASDEDFFFAGRRLNAFQAFLSVLSSETSVATIVAFPAAGLLGGYALVWLLAGYIVGRSIVAIFYLRKLYESSRLTIYQTMSGSHRVLEAAYLLAKYISGGVRFYMGGYALHQLLGGPTSRWICVVGICAASYSIKGGLGAVVIMDQVQGILIVSTGVFLCLFLGLHLPEGAVWDPAYIDLDPSHVNFFPALFLGGAVLSIGSHGADQDMLLRVLATKSLRTARKSLILSGFGAAALISLYLTIGYLLYLTAIPGLDVKSPLTDYVTKSDLPMLQGLFLVLLFAAAMSTLDSTINSTGAVWKSLMNSKRSGRLWSVLSLACITTSALFFNAAATRHQDFLSLAMGSMNYINGGMIGIFTVFTFFPNRLKARGIPLALVTGFGVTAICEWAFAAPIPWPYTVLLSSSASLAACLAASLTPES